VIYHLKNIHISVNIFVSSLDPGVPNVRSVIYTIRKMMRHWGKELQRKQSPIGFRNTLRQNRLSLKNLKIFFFPNMECATLKIMILLLATLAGGFVPSMIQHPPGSWTQKSIEWNKNDYLNSQTSHIPLFATQDDGDMSVYQKVISSSLTRYVQHLYFKTRRVIFNTTSTKSISMKQLIISKQNLRMDFEVGFRHAKCIVKFVFLTKLSRC
jgi:hypothetical protein